MGKLRAVACVVGCVVPAPARADDDHSIAAHGEELAAQVPEPMVFDLVRGLGAHRGELEINALGRPPLNRFSDRAIEWAPEVELAVHDGVGLELELPFSNGHLEALKFAGQVTLSGLMRRRFLHGVQGIVEKELDRDGVELSLLYIPVVRFSDTFSALSMIGGRALVGGGEEGRGETLLVNTTFYAEPNRETAFGLEFNLAVPRGGGATLLVMPQVEHEFDHHWTVQAGAGVELGGGEDARLTGALRLVWATAFHLHSKKKTATPVAHAVR
jgi:hypothetical protein